MGRGKAVKTLEREAACRAILQAIQPATVRAVAYRLFNQKLLDSMKKSQTNIVSQMLVSLREAGVVPWAWVVDESRDEEVASTWNNIEAYTHTIERAYRRDYWAEQPVLVKVWSEKSTVGGILRPVLRQYGVPFQSLHGFSSATQVYDQAVFSAEEDRPVLVYYVGDWDPSGPYMSEVDLPERLERYEGRVHLRRLALDRQDTATLGDGPSFAAEDKQTDTRYQWFIARYGRRCWELDAMNPNTLRQRVEQAILRHIDTARWVRSKVAEETEKESFRTIIRRMREMKGGPLEG
jgi:hypothetical protein